MNLSLNFTSGQFHRPFEPIPEECMPILREFCAYVLEPIRTYIDMPIRITSGYRSPARNKWVGGVDGSFHVYTPARCAADIQLRAPLNMVFDWIRLRSGVPFDKAILERGNKPGVETDDCIHLQYQRNPRRLAYVGSTHGTGKYTKMEVT